MRLTSLARSSLPLRRTLNSSLRPTTYFHRCSRHKSEQDYYLRYQERTPGNMADSSHKGTEKGGGEAVEFNLSDPDQLARQLQRVDLTEEESDELLREAYKVNKQLKMMLKQKQNNIAASLRSQSASSSTSPKGSRSILPPINAKGSAVPQRSLKAYGHGSGKNATGSTASAKPQSKTGKTTSAVQKPGWDDRFAYS